MPDYNETKAMGLSDITRFHKSGSSVGGGGGGGSRRFIAAVPGRWKTGGLSRVVPFLRVVKNGGIRSTISP